MERFNALPADKLTEKLTRICASKKWVSEMVKRRPFENGDQLLKVASEVWEGVPREDKIEAFNGRVIHHRPALGDVNYVKEHDLWSVQEDFEALLSGEHDSGVQEMVEIAKKYRAKFGFEMILLAYGLTVQQQLEKMKTRLEYDLEKEWPINCSEEFKITFRRLQKLIDDDDPYEHLTRFVDVNESRAFVYLFNVKPARMEPSQPLYDRIFVVQDFIDVKGYVTGLGNPFWTASHPPATSNAVCVELLLSAGARCVGKTVTDEFGMGADGANPHFKTPLNNKARDRLCGGPASGSASAVSCGLVDFALGVDGGAGIRMPASFTGVFGFAFSAGRVSMAGAANLAPSFGRLGVLARSPHVVVKVGEALLGSVVPAITADKVGTVYIAKDAFQLSDKEVSEALQASLGLLKKLFGDKVKETTLSELGYDLNRGAESYFKIMSAEVANSIGAFVEYSPAGALSDKSRRMWEHVAKSDRSQLSAVYKARAESMRLTRSLRSGDLVVLPTTATTAPAIGTAVPPESLQRNLSLTCIAANAALSAASLPFGKAGGAPCGLQLLSAEDVFLLGVVRFVTVQAQLSGLV